jgi:hypothetical protein
VGGEKDMNKSINLHNKNISYILKTSRRAKYMRLSVQPDGSLVVTKPFWLSQKAVEKFIIKKAGWVIEKIEHWQKYKHLYIFQKDQKNYLKHKAEASKFITERIEYCNKVYNFSYNKISIRAQKTRWGSCSQHGNLNFNYKILFLPRHLADYIIVHELCHLRELNHSKKFWNLVAKAIPDYKAVKKELRGRGMMVR